MFPPSIAEASALLLRHGFGASTVSRALALVGREMAVDRVYIFEDVVEDGERYTSQRYEWSSEGAEPQIDNPALQHIPYAAIAPEWEAVFSRGEVVKGLVREMEGPAREFMMGQGIRSILMCPIMLGEGYWGFVGFDDCHSDRSWPDDEVRALRRFSMGLSGVLYSQQSQVARQATREILQEMVKGSTASE